MVEFKTIILKFAEQGEKTGWTYIDVPADIAQQLKPGNKKSFRVKGHLDDFSVSGIALLPMGEGNFILPLNSEIRKAIRKEEGATLNVRLEVDNYYVIHPPPELVDYMEEDLESKEYFYSLTKSHRDYFVKWIDSAKTEPTRLNRIVQTAHALAQRFDYGQMIRYNRKIRNL